MRNRFIKIKWEVLITFIISLTSIFVAIKANNISKMQAEIARSSALPTICVDEKIQECDGVGWEESSTIEISNLSGKMNDYQAKVVTFLSCGYFANDTADYVVVDIPIENYYLLNIREGVTTGLIEKKDAAGNYSKVEKLRESIRRFSKENLNGQSIDTTIESFLRISYTDLLNEKQVSYYMLDAMTENMIDLEDGQARFNKYEVLTRKDFSINTNRVDEISVDEVIEKIEGIINLGELDLLSYGTDASEEDYMEQLNEPFLSTIIGAIIGLLGSILGGLFAEKTANQKQTKFAASVLYNDLKSIETYFKNDEISVNLRYSENWQNMVASCVFLSDAEVALLYSIYDEVYNYNYCYGKKDINTFRERIIKILFDGTAEEVNPKRNSVEFENLMNNLCIQKK